MNRKQIGLAAAVIMVFSIASLHAQQVKRHPGDIVKFEVKFDGPDAAKVKFVDVTLRSKSGAPSNQAGFSTNLGGNKDFEMVAPNTFAPEIKIPDNAASGDYDLEINAVTPASAGSASYIEGKDFQLPLIPIENSRTFVPPHITVTEKP